jgi:hypothetical protein
MSSFISIIGILVPNRATLGPQVQEVLTKHGDKILSRCGYPDLNKDDGIITLVVDTNENDAAVIVNDLKQIPGVTAASINLR